MEKQKIIQKLFQRIFPAKYRKDISESQTIGRSARLKHKFNQEFGTNFWAHYKRVGESCLYRLTHISAAKTGPTIISISDDNNWNIHSENLAWMKTKNQQEKIVEPIAVQLKISF